MVTGLTSLISPVCLGLDLLLFLFILRLGDGPNPDNVDDKGEDFKIFSRVLRDSIGHYVCLSVGLSVTT